MVHFFRRDTIALLFAAALALPQLSSASEPPATIVTTTSIIADAVRTIAAPQSQVIALMKEGTDPHTYKASPGDLRLISQASVLFSNGLNLEGRLQEALERLKTRKAVYAVAEMIPHEKLREVSPGTGIFDPHIWFDVSLWALATTEIGQTLATLDPDRSADYLQRAALYTTRLEELHRWCTQSIASIPSDQRVLITAHDAFGYFGRAYNIHVLGIQGISTESEPSLSGINKLVDLVVTRHIPAVFVESSVSPRTVQALIEGARRRGAKLTPGKELFSDALGPPNSEQGTYLGMIRYNVSAITEALSGREAHDTH